MLPRFEAGAVEEPTGRVPVEHFQQLCHDCGETLSAEECGLSLRVHLAHNAVMTELRAQYKAKHLFSFHQESTVNGKDKERVSRDGFLAWWLSPRLTLLPLSPFASAACGALSGPGSEKGASMSLQLVSLAMKYVKERVHSSRTRREMSSRPKMSRNE